MITIDLTKKIKALDGTEGDSLGKLLSGYLANKTENIPAIRAFSWAQKFFNDEAVEMDVTDKKDLIKFVSENKELINLLKAQLLQELEK